MAEIIVKATTQTSITVCLGGLQSDYSKDDRYVRWYLMPEATPFATTYIDAYASESDTVTITGLTANTTYNISAISYWTAGNGEPGTTNYTLTVRTAETSNKISLWSWTSSNGSATAEQTKKAYTAVTTKGYISAFSYLVWNDLVSKANEYITKYQENTWSGDILSLSATKMTGADKRLTADRFNSLRYEMNRFFSNYPMVSTGDEVKGSYFTDIATQLNIEINFANSQ